jgi:hypothetical protein
MAVNIEISINMKVDRKLKVVWHKPDGNEKKIILNHSNPSVKIKLTDWIKEFIEIMFNTPQNISTKHTMVLPIYTFYKFSINNSNKDIKLIEHAGPSGNAIEFAENDKAKWTLSLKLPPEDFLRPLADKNDNVTVSDDGG